MLSDHAEAEDVAQETFLRLLEKVDSWQPGGPKLKTWLYRVAINLCIDRRRSYRPMSIEDVANQADPTTYEAAFDRRIDHSRTVKKALDRLPGRQQIAMTLVHYQGFTNREAAEMLGVSVEALESLLARARRSIRQELQPVISDLLGESR